MKGLSERKGCLGMLMGIFGIRGGRMRFPYGMRDAFLSPAEISFFHVLKGTLGLEHHVITKVNLFDLFYVSQPHVNQAAINRIDRKHVDFVVCEAGTMRPVLAIELDDASHLGRRARETDGFKDEVFRVAGLPLLRVKAARGYVPQELTERMRVYLGGRGNGAGLGGGTR